MTINPVILAVNIARAYEICLTGGYTMKIIPSATKDETEIYRAQLENIKYFEQIYQDVCTDNPQHAAIVIEMHNIGSQDILRSFMQPGSCETIEDIKSRVNATIKKNSMPKEPLCQSGSQLLKTAIDRLHLSIRQVAFIHAVAKTIAHMAGSDTIRPEHVAEAIQYQSSQV